jgi:hypothetical protein
VADDEREQRDSHAREELGGNRERDNHHHRVAFCRAGNVQLVNQNGRPASTISDDVTEIIFLITDFSDQKKDVSAPATSP